MCIGVSAVELLKEAQSLSAQERQKLLLALIKLEEKPRGRRTKGKRVKWPDVESRARRIFGDRVFPNLVLLERDEEAS